MSYKVRLDLFEGPFELLIYLIEHARMSVYDIKVSEITTQYLEYVSKLQEIDPQLAQEFMVLAAELIEIKSRMLLPGRQKEEGEAEEDDPRTGLVQRILEYKQFRELASMLDDRQEQTSHMHVKPREDLSRWTGVEDELLTGSTEQLVKAFELFLTRRQRIDEIRRTYRRQEENRRSMETRISEISAMFKGRKTLMFSEIIREDPSVFNRILSFMSLLEMMKQGGIKAEQKKRYGDIKLTAVPAGKEQ